MDGDKACLILGDNLFHGGDIGSSIIRAKNEIEEIGGAHLFGTAVPDPGRFGVAEISESGDIMSIDEKPEEPKSNIAVTGLYMYGSDVCERAKKLSPSKRGELEITSVNSYYLDKSDLKVNILGRGFAWLDTGTIDSINNASNYIRAIEERQGLKIACLEEIAYLNKFINKSQLKELIKNLPDDYANYLRRLITN